MQTKTVLITQKNVAAMQRLFYTALNVTYVANSNVFLTEKVVFVASSNAVTQQLVDYVSNVLYN